MSDNGAPKINLPTLLLFGSSLLQNGDCLRQWSNFSILSDLAKKPHEYQVALLKNNLGDDAMRVYEGFHFDTPDDVRTVAEILAKQESYAVGEANETYERSSSVDVAKRRGEALEFLQ